MFFYPRRLAPSKFAPVFEQTNQTKIKQIDDKQQTIPAKSLRLKSAFDKLAPLKLQLKHMKSQHHNQTRTYQSTAENAHKHTPSEIRATHDGIFEFAVLEIGRLQIRTHTA
jgi:hypothetical protein